MKNGALAGKGKTVTKQELLKILEQNGDVYYRLPDNIKKDHDVTISAIKGGFPIEDLAQEDRKDPDIQICAVKYAPSSIVNIEDPCTEAQVAAVEKSPVLVRYIKDPVKEAQVAAVKGDPDLIQYIKDPDRDVQLEAVQKRISAIRHIKNPVKETQVIAVKGDPELIKCIKDPVKEAQLIAVKEELEAVRSYGGALQFLEEADEELIMKALAEDGDAVRFVKDPNEKMQLAAVMSCGTAVYYIHNPSEKVQMEAVMETPYAISYIKDPSKKVQLAAVSEAGETINGIEDPDEDVQLAAVKQYPSAIEYIKSPCEAVQTEAVRRDPEAILYINGPICKGVKDLVKEDPFRFSFMRTTHKNEGRSDDIHELEDVVDEGIDRAYEQMEQGGMAYYDGDICVLCLNAGTKADISETEPGKVDIRMKDPVMDRNLKYLQPGEYTMKTYYIERSRGAVNLYGNEKCERINGAYKAETIAKNISVGKALGIVEKGIPGMRSMKDIERLQDIRKNVKAYINAGRQEKRNRELRS